MMTRRDVLLFTVATAALVAARSPAFAQAGSMPAGGASAFVHSFGDSLVAVVNGEGSLSQKEVRLRPLIDQNVDVDAIARFCLGRFTNAATPQQVAEFTKLFHAVLVDNITSKLGEYRGVTFTMGGTSQRGGETLVSTVLQRPNNAPNSVQWVVDTTSGAPKIVDVVAEGTSLRLTQRSDYASYMSQHGNSVAALISAMKAQVSAG